MVLDTTPHFKSLQVRTYLDQDSTWVSLAFDVIGTFMSISLLTTHSLHLNNLF